MKKTSILAFCAFVIGIGNMPSVADIMDASALLDFPNPPADHVVSYGQDELQFGELRLPAGDGPHPVMVLIHGGCWLSEFDIAHIRKLAAAFTAEGIATWTIEYRRVGDPGGGWRGTFDDAAAGTDFLATLAEQFDLDLQRVVFAGHSAGGHLAIWLANRPSQWPAVVTPIAVLGLAPAADLAYAHKQGYCDNVVDKLMGGSPSEVPERYQLGSGSARLPLPVPQYLILGHFDDAWSPVARSYIDSAKSKGNRPNIIEAVDSGHFEMIDPDSSTWPLVINAARAALELK
jgi:acetyl esterase/lipase